jgi:hypothetical protein
MEGASASGLRAAVSCWPTFCGSSSLLTLINVLCFTDERLLLAAKDDNEEMMLEVLEDPKLDINHRDGSVSYISLCRFRWQPEIAPNLGRRRYFRFSAQTMLLSIPLVMVRFTNHWLSCFCLLLQQSWKHR